MDTEKFQLEQYLQKYLTYLKIEKNCSPLTLSCYRVGVTAVRPVDFIVNRPFILLIRDDRTGNILFIGKILEP